METAPWNMYILTTLVPSMLTIVIVLLAAILFNVRRAGMINVDPNQHGKEKTPEEHDERFATTVRRRRGSRLSLPCILMETVAP